MSTVTKGVSMFILSVMMLALLVMIALGFMLGFTHPLPWILIGVLLIIPFVHDRIVSRRFVTWKNAYSVGIDSIDQDHKKLLSMINQLQTAVHYQTDDEMVEKTLNELMDYTRYHFAREEKLMQENDYPDFEAHKQQHDRMVAEVSKFIDEYRVDKTRTIDNVLLFLKTWLINHINGSDQAYAPHLRGKN